MMKRWMIVACVFCVAPHRCLADNPIVQTRYTADPAPLVVGDTMYVYTGHDEDDAKYFEMKDWRCYSTKDMVNWTDRGSPLSLEAFAWAKSDAWAGHCIERAGKFYWYVPVNQKSGGMAIGVAVADSPTGPFKDALGKPLVFDKWGDIDPAAFIDDDGQAYLYWGNPILKYVKINADMISFDKNVGEQGIVRGPMTTEAFQHRDGNVADRPTQYEEGPWVSKHGGKYYLFYAGGPVPEHLAYATGSSATGPWTYGGLLMATQGRAFTNHPGVVDFLGRSYLFYHNGALPGGGGFTRSVCVEEFKYNDDGTIPTIPMTDRGPAAIGTFDPYVRNEAETIAWEQGVRTRGIAAEGIEVCDIDDGDSILLRSVDFGPEGAAIFTARVASQTRAKAAVGGTIEIHLDSVQGPLIGRVPVSFTDSQWQDLSTIVSGANGIHDLAFVFKGEASGNLFTFDSWKFERRQQAQKLVALQTRLERYKLDTAEPGNRAKLNVFALYADGTERDVTKQASIQSKGTTNVVAVEPAGLIVSKAVGVDVLTIAFEDQRATIPIVVKDIRTEYVVRSLTTDVKEVHLLNGGSRVISVDAEYLDGHRENVTNQVRCESDHPEVATFDAGHLRARGKGDATIFARFQGERGDAVTTSIRVSVKNRDPYAQNEAEECNEQKGLIIEPSSEAGQNLCDANDGEWLKVSALEFHRETAGFEMRVASATAGGTLEVRLDSPEGLVIGTCSVGNTGGWQSWMTVRCDVQPTAGTHDVYLRFKGGDGVLFNLNWWRFIPANPE